jgi:hypothetical protein
MAPAFDGKLWLESQNYLALKGEITEKHRKQTAQHEKGIGKGGRKRLEIDKP